MQGIKQRTVKTSFAIILCIFLSSNVLAADESQIVSSGQEIFNSWVSFLNKGIILVDYKQLGGGSYWCAYKYEKALNSNPKFDIQKTNSLVRPYILIFSDFYLVEGYNYESPNSNSVRKIGFASPEDALKYTHGSDFKWLSNPKEIKFEYVFENGGWKLSKANSEFNKILQKMELSKSYGHTVEALRLSK
jgi:hypothetical protein